MAKEKKNTKMKDAYYFPHFCNARHDRKIKRVRKELGMEGYGIFFMLLEILREQADFRYPLDDIDLLSDELETSEQKVRTIISNYGLFSVDENNKFFSSNLILYLMPYLEKSKNAKVAAFKRWGRHEEIPHLEEQFNANAMQMHCDSNAPAMQRKENIVDYNKVEQRKEIKENARENDSQSFDTYTGKNQIKTAKDKFSLLTNYWNEKVPQQATPFTEMNMSLSGDIITLLDSTDIQIIKTAIDHYGLAYEHNKYRVASFSNFMTIKNVESWFPESSVENRKGKGKDDKPEKEYTDEDLKEMEDIF